MCYSFFKVLYIVCSDTDKGTCDKPEEDQIYPLAVIKQVFVSLLMHLQFDAFEGIKYLWPPL